MSNPVPPRPGHVFISYVREDSHVADELKELLEAEGFSVWMDRNSIPGGTRWKAEIQKAITQNSLAFVACYSKTGETKKSNGQNEELDLAAGELRKRRPDTMWLFNVRFDDSDIPRYNIGNGEVLGDIQRLDFFGATKAAHGQQLVNQIKSLLDEEPPAASAPAAPPVAPASTPTTAPVLGSAPTTLAPTAIPTATTPAASRLEELERIISTPGQKPSVDRGVQGILRPVYSELQDIDKFPPAYKSRNDPASRVQQMVDQAGTYRDVVDPAIDLFILGGLWGAEDYAPIFQRSLNSIAATRVDTTRPGSPIHMARDEYLTGLALFPTTLLMYAATIAALREGNYRLIQALLCEAELDVSEQFGGVTFYRPMIVGASPYYSLRDDTILQALLANQQQTLTEEMLGAIVDNRLRRRPRFPASRYLRETLRPNFEKIGIHSAEYEKLFDQAEVLFSMVTADIKDLGRVYTDPWLGVFAQRSDTFDESNSVWSRYLEESERAGGDWLPLSGGLFAGSPDRAKAAAQNVRALIEHYLRNNY
ncbi:hypothetical protein H351_29855 (plasmid) [Rhodococcus erythropolis R138]|uniref:toll/interleukin-1 receptor domain-containing protein n=1 Tax=Rhodococcus erythropolis TaxID=1833 RepID=UPI000492D0AC|nr:toll/interleukin-1 receptor domain-containing protein [Rhodococcus erythropolis]ALU73348.1 hypothetical protein H351_29855 [Rhodococcus erythropolis R138]